MRRGMAFTGCLPVCQEERTNWKYWMFPWEEGYKGWTREPLKGGRGQREIHQFPPADGQLSPWFPRSSKTGSTQLTAAGHSCNHYQTPCNNWLGLIKYNAQARPMKLYHKGDFNQPFICTELCPKKSAFVCPDKRQWGSQALPALCCTTRGLSANSGSFKATGGRRQKRLLESTKVLTVSGHASPCLNSGHIPAGASKI